MKLVITGTPCTGKSTLAKALSEENSWPLFDLNKIAEEKKLYTGKAEHGAKEVKIGALHKEVLKRIEKEKNYVVEGHLACEFAIPCDFAIVLRANPLLLLKRMKARKYPLEKTRDNLLCEILDYCLVKTEVNYPREKIIQIDATKQPSAKTMLLKISKRNCDKVDWMPLLLKKGAINELVAE